MPQKKSKVAFRLDIPKQIKTIKRYKKGNKTQEHELINSATRDQQTDDVPRSTANLITSEEEHIQNYPSVVEDKKDSQMEGMRTNNLENESKHEHDNTNPLTISSSLDTAVKQQEPVHLGIDLFGVNDRLETRANVELVEETPNMMTEEKTEFTTLNELSKKTTMQDIEVIGTATEYKEIHHHKNKALDREPQEEVSNSKNINQEMISSLNRVIHERRDSDYLETTSYQRGKSKSRQTGRKQRNKNATSQKRKTKMDTLSSIQ